MKSFHLVFFLYFGLKYVCSFTVSHLITNGMMQNEIALKAQTQNMLTVLLRLFDSSLC